MLKIIKEAEITGCEQLIYLLVYFNLFDYPLFPQAYLSIYIIYRKLPTRLNFPKPNVILCLFETLFNSPD